MMRVLALGLALACLGFAPLPFVRHKKPASPLLGLWELLGQERFKGGESKEIPKSRLRIEKGKAIFERDGKPYQTYTMTTDEKARTLDLSQLGVTYLGIYKIEGDQLLWSSQLNKKERPSGFKPMSPEHITMKLRRVKEPSKEMPK